MVSNSSTVKLSLFIFEFNACGVFPILRANSATLIFERTHNILICSDTVISIIPCGIKFYVDIINDFFYKVKILKSPLLFTLGMIDAIVLRRTGVDPKLKLGMADRPEKDLGQGLKHT
jgi:hypothetical protein